MNAVNVYGADWCEDTQQTLDHLDALGVPYDYIDIESDVAAQQWVLEQNDGQQRTPTLDIAGQILVEPSASELEEALRRGGLA